MHQMQKLLSAGAALCVLALSLAGCNAGSKIVAARDFLAEPKTQVAANLLIAQARAGATLISCFVGAGSSIALAVEQKYGAGGQTTTGIINASSSAVCAALRGSAQGSAVAQGGEPVVTGATAAPAAQ